MAVKLSSQDNRYSILVPVITTPRLDLIWITDSLEDLRAYVNDVPKNELAVALDFETKGNDFSRPDFAAVGLGLSCSIGSLYVDLQQDSDKIKQALEIINGLPLVGHNLMFDCGVTSLYGYTMDNFSWSFDTYAGYMHLASEGFDGQRWGLKDAQIDMLGWTETNEKDLDLWLVRAGYTVGDKYLNKSHDERAKLYNSYTSKGQRKCRPKKGEMWRAPADILGKYCALDADSTWQLFVNVIDPALRRLPPEYLKHHQEDFLVLVQILIEQQFSGTYVNLPKLLSYHERLKQRIQKDIDSIKNSDYFRDSIQEYEATRLKEFLSKEPEKYIKQKTRKPPKQTHKKDGTPTKTYLEYLDFQSKKAPPVVSKNWEAWERKRVSIELGNDPKLNKEYKFNVNSDLQLKEIIYGKLIKWCWIKEHVSDKDRGIIKILDTGAELETTESGALPLGKDALNNIGPVGELLKPYVSKAKEEGYVAGCVQRVDPVTGLVHLQTRAPGTLTGRLAGTSGLNYQQLPKSYEYLECWEAKPGYTLINADFEALEPHVLAEISRDPALLQLYGPNAKPNDVYLFTGAQLKGIGDFLAKEGYDPYSPDPELISSLKVKYKKERGIFKVIVLSGNYGAGPGRMFQQLKLSKVEIDFETVVRMHKDFNETYKGIGEVNSDLIYEWKNNKGWVLNGIGRPICVYEKYLKDIVNRVIQSTGHDVLIKYLRILRGLLNEHRVDYYWMIADFHDQTTIGVRQGQEPLALELFKKAEDLLNEELDTYVRLKMKPDLIKNFAEAKDLERKLDEAVS